MVRSMAEVMCLIFHIRFMNTTRNKKVVQIACGLIVNTHKAMGQLEAWGSNWEQRFLVFDQCVL